MTAAFFIPEPSGSMWPSIIWGSVAALCYLTAFSVVWLKEVRSTVKKRAIGAALAILVVFSGISAALSYEGSTRQADLLPHIRSTIEMNVAHNYVKEPLIETLKTYSLEKESSDTASIGQLFLAKYDSLIAEDHFFRYGALNPDQTLKLFVAEAGEDSIVVIAESRYLEGRQADFQNFSGAKGRYQTEGTLTEQGVRYERTN